MKCKRCGIGLIILSNNGTYQGRDFNAESFGLCDDCRNGNKKRCHCGTWHLLPGNECLTHFLERRKEEKEYEFSQ